MHLAEFNVARLIEPLDSPRLADFVAQLAELNAVADAAPGFIWRMVDGGGADATGLRPLDPDVIVNLTLWESVERLRDFVYRSRHLESLRRRREWFHPSAVPQTVLWWVPVGHRPTLAEGTERLAHLREHGTGPDAFTLRDTVPA